MDEISTDFIDEMIKDGKGETLFLEFPSGQKFNLKIDVLDKNGEIMLDLNTGNAELVVN